MGGMTRLLLLLWAGVTVGSVVDLQKRIIGGKPCSVTERGYHAFITFTEVTRTSTRTSSCGGSLIDKNWILTAAHCWKEGRNITVVLGPHTKQRTTVEIELPPKPFEEKHKGNTRQHDIMLLKLKEPTTIKPVRLPVTLPDCANKPTKGKTVKIAGYYSTIQPGDINDPDKVDEEKPLQCADTTVVDCVVTTCLEPIPYTRPLKRLLCFKDWLKKVDATKGDSGGGVVYAGKIYGVIATGHNETCAGPAQAMDVCSYMGWIERTTGILRQRLG